MRSLPGDTCKPHLRKSADRKAQISPVSGTNAFLICAFRSADFLRWCLTPQLAQPHAQSLSSTVRIGYRVTGYNDLPGIMIGLTKIKIKTSKRYTKYHFIQCISAVVIYRILILKTIGNRKEIVREVVRGDKHNLRKSANCRAQISTMCGVNDTDLCMLCDLQIFSGCVCHLEQLHAQSPFLFPIVFSINYTSKWRW